MAHILDVLDTQVLVEFPGDQFRWHHRILVKRISGSNWMNTILDHNIEEFDFSTERDFIVFGRGAPYFLVVGRICVFDVADKFAMARFRRLAKFRAQFIG